MKNRDPNYTPTPAEIRRACREIQATWTPQEERKRRKGIADEDHVEVKRLRMGEPQLVSAQIHGFLIQGADSGR